jgi:hypothetical protein
VQSAFQAAKPFTRQIGVRRFPHIADALQIVTNPTSEFLPRPHAFRFRRCLVDEIFVRMSVRSHRLEKTAVNRSEITAARGWRLPAGHKSA